MKQLIELSSWAALDQHAQSFRSSASDSVIAKKQFQLSPQSIHLDISRQRIDEIGLELLLDLAKESNLKEKIFALLRGDKVNKSEHRPALHTALRCSEDEAIFVDGKNIVPQVIAAREKMWLISNQIRSGQWLGYSGKPITSIVNIGAGGSDLGARFCINALADYTDKNLSYHFVSDVDPTSFNTAVNALNPETTLFIISSKTFTTPETLYNAKKALNWIGAVEHYHQHFIAITANDLNAKNFGIQTILPIWEWIGGRYSLCSAINLITCIAIGFERFLELLAGAKNMDTHFQASDFHENMPVILALMGIWNINFLQIPSLLLLIYASKMEKLVPYIQQLDMESNGKSIDNNDRRVNYATGPIVWGGLGNQAQHSYYQLLCQGTHTIAADFISIQTFNNDLINNYCESKIQVLSKGISSPNPNSFIPGGMPINHISLAACSPFCLGALIALYEHKIFTQSVIWNINPFDQPGVESAKTMHPLVEAI